MSKKQGMDIWDQVGVDRATCGGRQEVLYMHVANGTRTVRVVQTCLHCGPWRCLWPLGHSRVWGVGGQGSFALPLGSFGLWWASHTQRPGSWERRPAAESRSAIGQRPLSSTGEKTGGMQSLAPSNRAKQQQQCSYYGNRLFPRIMSFHTFCCQHIFTN